MNATIYLDGAAFSGVDLRATWPEDSSAFRAGAGWHHAPGNGRDVLTFGGEPHVCQSARTIAGYVSDIIGALQDGLLTGHTITIEVQS